MNDKLVKALEFGNYRQTLNNQLHKANIRAESFLIFAKNGGEFNINQGLICYLDYLVRCGLVDSVLLDSKGLPIAIDNIPEFLKEITTRYFEVTNDFLQEYHNIKKARSVKS